MTLPVNIESDLLPLTAWDELTALSSELSDAYAKRQIFRTETEARVSVLDKIHFPTKAAKYWQSVREQTVMLEQLALLSFEYRRNEVMIKRHTASMQEAQNSLDLEDAQINLDECMFKRVNMRTVATDRAREISMWSKIKKEVDDGSFDTKNVDSHQLVSYATQFALTAAATNMSQMSVGEATNLAGQLQTTLDRCHEQGVIDKVYENLPAQVSKQLRDV
jgi:hypothetical protein